MTVRRCLACGAFFDGDACPNDHSHIETWAPPPLPPERLPTLGELRGRVVSVRFAGGDQPVFGVITDNADAQGTVGFMPLNTRVRVHMDDVEEI